MEFFPIHQEYLLTTPRNSVECLLGLLDAMQPHKMRDEATMGACMMIVRPATRDPVSVHDTIGSIFQEHVSYNRFKEGLRKLAEHAPEPILVTGTVQHILSYISNIAFTDIGEIVERNRTTQENCRQQLSTVVEEWHRAQLQEQIEMVEDHIAGLPKRITEHRRFYVEFCEVVLQGLLDEHEARSDAALERLRGLTERLSKEPFPGSPTEE